MKAQLLPIFMLLPATVVGQEASAWVALNGSVNGRLHRVTPFALPCFGTYESMTQAPNTELCNSVQKSYTNSSYRHDIYSAYMYTQSEICMSEDENGYTLDETIPALPNPANRTCRQGNLASYYIEVTGASDIVAAVRFATANKIALSVKNSGHDFLTRSSLKRSLALWTAKLINTTHNEFFVPAGCPAGMLAQDVVALGAGITSDRVYAYANSINRTYVGGYSPMVGVAGGYLLGGGHSVLSPVYGLAVDRVVEFHVVTADGEVRLANACQNSDLFWALRGGGGSVFGIVLSSTSRVEKAEPIAVASISFGDTSKESTRQWLKLMIDESLEWANQGWGGHIWANMLVYMNPLLSRVGAERSMAKAAAFARARNGTVTIEALSWWEIYGKFVRSAPIGVMRMTNSRIVPGSMFANAEGKEKIMGSLDALLDNNWSTYIPVDSPFMVDDKKNETSVTRAWRGSVWTISGSTTLPWNSTYAERLDLLVKHMNTTLAGEDLTNGVPGAISGAYGSEANAFTQNWREEWWGTENYEKLLQIKNKYDPNNILTCWKCVGFDESVDLENGRYSCMAKLQKDIDAAFATSAR
jgi:FAD/FMN-containing dehydrogenase